MKHSGELNFLEVEKVRSHLQYITSDQAPGSLGH